MPTPLDTELLIRPRGRLDSTVRVPGSKSLSNRVLLMAGLARGTSRLTGVLRCDDTEVMARAMRAVGADVGALEAHCVVTGVAGQPTTPADTIDVGASGTAARFLTGLMSILPGATRLDGIARMRERPIGPLVHTLRQLGADITAESPNECPPVVSAAGVLRGGSAAVDASTSSQFLSAVLLVSPYAQTDVSVRIENGALASRPYVDLTLDTMRAFGAEVGWHADDEIRVTAQRPYVARDYDVEPDASTAAFFFAAAALTGGRIVVPNLAGASPQADMRVLDVLEAMGCRVVRAADQVEITGPPQLRGVDFDMNAMPDGVLAVCVAALFAEGTTTIRNVANLRIKETDRLSALETELRKLGATVVTTADSIAVTPGPLRAAAIDTYDDHRMAMAFALAGLRVPGIVIREPHCVSKSWPEYFDVFDQLV